MEFYIRVWRRTDMGEFLFRLWNSSLYRLYIVSAYTGCLKVMLPMAGSRCTRYDSLKDGQTGIYMNIIFLSVYIDK